jgi:hypothetical protein
VQNPISVASDKFSDAAGNINVDGADANNSVLLTIDTKVPTIAISSDVDKLLNLSLATEIVPAVTLLSVGVKVAV